MSDPGRCCDSGRRAGSKAGCGRPSPHAVSFDEFFARGLWERGAFDNKGSHVVQSDKTQQMFKIG